MIEGRFDSLFVSPHADDALLSCPGRIRAEVERGRRVLVLALFEPLDGGEVAAESVRRSASLSLSLPAYAAPARPAASARAAMVAYRVQVFTILLIFVSCRLEAVLSKTPTQAYGGCAYTMLKRRLSCV